MLLADHLREAARAVLAGQDDITHRGILRLARIITGHAEHRFHPAEL
jgi:hypothetical protein